VTLGRLRAAATGGGARAAAEREMGDATSAAFSNVLQGKGHQTANGRLFWGGSPISAT